MLQMARRTKIFKVTSQMSYSPVQPCLKYVIKVKLNEETHFIKIISCNKLLFNPISKYW